MLNGQRGGGESLMEEVYDGFSGLYLFHYEKGSTDSLDKARVVNVGLLIAIDKPRRLFFLSAEREREREREKNSAGILFFFFWCMINDGWVGIDKRWAG